MMRYHLTHRAGAALVLGLCVGLAGCARKPSGAPPAAPPAVTVSYPVERAVTDYADFTARTAAVDSVEVRAHVWGYLDKVHFKEGALVKKGDVLFEIDPRIYEAEVETAKGAVAYARASVELAKADLERGRQLLPSGGISREDYDTRAAKKHQAAAQLLSNKAALQRAELNLGFCKVCAPISGRVSRYAVTLGNLIQSGDQGGGTLLTTIVSVDPMYAYFDVDERTVLRVKQLIREGKARSPDDAEIPVWLGLANQDRYPRRGTVNFIDNQVNPKTGTLRVRGVFPNQDEALSPGYFVRVRVPIGAPHKALLITDRALDTDQGQKIVYVVDKHNRVMSRPVRTGALHDGLREITDGLKPGERVIVNGLQQVRPGVTVESKLVAMPQRSGVRNQESGNRKQTATTRAAKATP